MFSYKSKFSSKFILLNLLTLGMISGFNNNLNSEEIKSIENSANNINTQITQKYLDPKNSLKDYIIDSGDELFIEFEPARELNTFFKVNSDGEIFLPKIYDTYVKGLTISELSYFLENRFSNYLIDPKIKVFLVKFRDIKVTITGEVKSPGIYTFKDDNKKTSTELLYLNGDNNTSRVRALVQKQTFYTERPSINSLMGNTVEDQ